jgi:hypothetical protein
MSINSIGIILLTFLLVVACSQSEQKSRYDLYNITWNTESRNSSESMPLVSGDIGCNVWVENGDLLLYVQRSGSLSENGEYLKMGRFRIQLNPKEKLFPDYLIKQQGLEEYKDEIFDDLKNRTFGGYVYGDGLVEAGTGEGKYQITPFRSWKLKSEAAKKKHHISIATHIEQAETVEEWKKNLFEVVHSKKNRKEGFKLV